MRIISPLLIALVFLLLSSCSALSDISNALASLKKMEFRISGLTNMRIAGIDISRLSDPSKLSIADGIALSSAFAQKSLPATFILNVDARNPNNGSQGARNTPLTLSGLDWNLLIDNKQTISGDIDKPIEIPGTAPLTTIPLSVSVDMYKFFSDRGYDGIMNLVLALGGSKGSTARVKLDAQPSVSTAFGTMTYPGRMTIVDSEFRGR